MESCTAISPNKFDPSIFPERSVPFEQLVELRKDVDFWDRFGAKKLSFLELIIHIPFPALHKFLEGNSFVIFFCLAKNLKNQK